MPPAVVAQDVMLAADQFKNQRWRLSNLYYIQDKEGNKVLFKPNWAQEELLNNFWYLNLLLKARQLGMTTFTDILLLDNAAFYADTRCGIIAHTRDDAKAIFQTKVKYPYEHLPDQIKEFLAPRQDSANEYLFSNNSSIRVGTSMRSGTLNYLHISEYGKLCAIYPDKAREIRTGALNTVQAGQSVIIESTAEGAFGHFFDLCKKSQDNAAAGRDLTPLDWKFHFFPWWKEPQYSLDESYSKDVVVTREYREYFKGLERDKGIVLSLGQKMWYIKKSDEQGEDMKREFPSTPEEAFLASIEGAFFKKEMAFLRKEKRLTRVPHEPALPVDTFWDLGMNDEFVIIFFQRYRHENRIIDCYHNNGEGLAHYAKILAEKPYNYGTHHLPHDAEVRELGTGVSRQKTLMKLRVRPLKVMPRIEDEMDGVEATRQFLPTCWIDEENCDYIIKCLDHYRKEWDEKMGTYKSRPLHDWASHGAKAFETLSVGWKAPTQKPKKKKKRANWRTA